jgi:hypothetical protein
MVICNPRGAARIEWLSLVMGPSSCAQKGVALATGDPGEMRIFPKPDHAVRKLCRFDSAGSL